MSKALGVLTGHTFVYLLGSVAAKAATILLLPVYTERIPPEAFGVLSLTDGVLGFLLQLVGFQLDAAMTRHYLDAEADATARRRVVQTAFFTLSLGVTVVAAALFVSADLVASWFPDVRSTDLGTALRYVAVILVAMVLTEIPLSLLKAERRSVAAIGWQLLRLFVEIGGKILLVVGFSMGVFGVLLGQAVAGVLFMVGFAVWLVRRFGVGFDAAVLRSMIAFSAPMALSGMCQLALHQADRFMMPKLAGFADLGLYEIGYKFGFAVTGVVLGPFLSIWYPFIFAIEDGEERRAVLAKVSVHVPALLVLVSAPVALFSPEIVRLFSEERYHGAWVYVPVILLSYLFWGVFQVTQTPFYIEKRTRRVPGLVLAAALVNIGLNLVLMPWFGGMGAAIATLGAMAVLTVMTWRAANRLVPVAVDGARLARLAVVCAAIAAAVYLAPDGRAGLAIRWVAFVAAAAYLIGPFLSSEERGHVVAMLRSRLGRGGSSS